MRNTYTPEFKAKVVREVLREDKTLSQVAAAHGLHPNLVSQWRDQTLAGMVSLFSRTKENDWAAKEAAHEQEKQDLYAEIGRLTTQLSWLKKKLANSLSRGERRALVEREAGEVSVVAQCALLSVSRSGLYYQPRPVAADTLALQQRIDEIYTACPFYGVRKITAQLRSEGRLQLWNVQQITQWTRSVGGKPDWRAAAAANGEISPIRFRRFRRFSP